MEKWREVFIKKLETKAFIGSEFLEGFEPTLDDEKKTIEAIDKDIVAGQLVWHWYNMKDEGCYYSDLKEFKPAYKSVANNLLKKHFTKNDFPEFYLTLDVSIEDEIVQLV